MRSLGLLGFLLLVPSGCSLGAVEDSESDEAAYTAADAQCFSTTPKDGESKTDARARCLTEQATRLVEAQIAKNEDPRDAALAAFRGKVRVPAGTGCFTEDVSGDLVGIVQHDI